MIEFYVFRDGMKRDSRSTWREFKKTWNVWWNGWCIKRCIDWVGRGKGRGEALKGILVADINRIGLRFIPSWLIFLDYSLRRVPSIRRSVFEFVQPRGKEIRIFLGGELKKWNMIMKQSIIGKEILFIIISLQNVSRYSKMNFDCSF